MKTEQIKGAKAYRSKMKLSASLILKKILLFPLKLIWWGILLIYYCIEDLVIRILKQVISYVLFGFIVWGIFKCLGLLF